MKPYIFISYAHKDSERVLPVVQTMQENGFRIWYDEGIDPGTEWDKNIATHISDSSYFIAFISNAYLDSSNCKDEINFARDLEKKLFLIYIEDVELPPEMKMRLSRIQNVYMHRYADRNRFYDKLFAAEGIEVCRETDCGDITTNSDSASNVIPTGAEAYPYKLKKKSWMKTVVFLLIVVLLCCLCMLFFRNQKDDKDFDSEPTTTSTPTSEPTATSTPVPTPEPTATNTPVPTPEPTATNTPVPTSEPTATSTPVPQEEDNVAEELFLWEVNADGCITILGIRGTANWDLRIPDTIDGKKVTEIGEKAFAECKSIGKVTIPEGVKTIGSRAFYQCENLMVIELPETLTAIGEMSFAFCSSLKSLELPDKLEIVGNFALYLSGISTVTVSASVRNIENGAFSLCNSLETIYVEEENENYKSSDGVLFDEELKILYCYPAGKSMEEYEIPYGVEVISADAFNGAVFNNVVIPETVTTIQADAFVNCHNLSALKIPKSVVGIGYLVDPLPMEIAEDNPCFKSDDKFLLSKDGKVLYASYRSSTDTTYRIPAGVEVISSYSFYCLGNVKEIVLPEGVIEIENEAFRSCTALEKIYIPETVTKLHKDAFSDMEADCKLIVKAGSYAEFLAISQGIPFETE